MFPKTTIGVAQYYLLDGLDAQSVFELLDPIVRKLPPELRGLAGQHLGLILKPAQQGVGVQLVVPEFRDANEELRRLSDHFAGLREHYARRQERNPAVYRQAVCEDVSPLLAGIAGLLLAGHELCGEQAAAQQRGEFLAVSNTGMTQEQAGTLFAQLAMQSTATRWSVADIFGRPRYFFSGHSDCSRNGNWESLVPALQSRFQVLRAFTIDGFTVFLPERLNRPMLGEANAGIVPGIGLLKHVRDLLTEFPELLAAIGLTNTTDQSVLLAVLPGESSSDSVLSAELLALPAARFHRNYFLDPQYQRITVAVPDLQFTQSAHHYLREYLKRHRDSPGYRLELRDTEVRTQEQNLGEIYRRYRDAEYQFHLLSEANSVRPTLMRFSHDQLPELARLMRALPLRTLNSGGISYACYTPAKASPTSPADADPISELSYHYLYFHEGWNDVAEVAPLLRFARDSERPAARTNGRPETMRFWLDPFWARPYHTGDNRCLVFVPEHKALFPTLHGWDAAEMDKYLSDVLNDFVPSDQRDNFARRPLFLFDGPFGPNDDRIAITVLDFDQFRPFQQRLDWINDHLDILESLDSIPERRSVLVSKVAGMANHARWELIAEELASRGQQAQDQVAAVAQRSHDDIIELIRNELSVFDKQLNDAFLRLQNVLEQARRLNAETVELRTYLRAAELARDQLVSEAHRLQHSTQIGQTRFDELERTSTVLLDKLLKSRVETEESLTTAATELAESRRRIRSFLSTLR